MRAGLFYSLSFQLGALALLALEKKMAHLDDRRAPELFARAHSWLSDSSPVGIIRAQLGPPFTGACQRLRLSHGTFANGSVPAQQTHTLTHTYTHHAGKRIA